MTSTDRTVLESGRGGAAGVGVGDAFWLPALDTASVEEPEGGPTAEIETFDDARETVAAGIDADADAADGETASILAVQADFLYDPAFEDAVADAVFEGESVADAVETALSGFVDEFEARGGRTAERADDLRDLRHRLLAALAGDGETEPTVPPGSVVLADRLTPSRVARLDLPVVAGLAAVHGGVTAHATLVAQDAGVPAVVGVGDALRAISGGDRVSVDGTNGTVAYGADVDAVTSKAGDLAASGPVSVDGQSVTVMANVGTLAGVRAASSAGADGIGLFRTELDAIERGRLPDEEAQVETYRRACEAFPAGRVLVRTYDFGGDKPHPSEKGEPSPFGVRGIRRSLGEDREAFETQLRALCRAAASPAGGSVTALLPFVTRVEEVETARSVLDDVTRALADEGFRAERPALGVMVETPAAVLVAPELANAADSLSLGTNDLVQYLLAADRTDETTAAYGDPDSLALRRCVERVVSAASDANVPLSCCGELAGEPVCAAALVDLGVTSLSVAPGAVQTVKRHLSGGGGA